MKRTLKIVLWVLAILFLVDMFVMVNAIGQHYILRKARYWTPFWKIQLKVVVDVYKLIK